MNLYQNKKLLEAFELYVRQQDALLPSEEELSTVTLSPAFHEKMKRLLTLRKRGFYVLFGTAGRRVASILIAVLLALTTTTVSVKALRESVLHFFAEVFERYTQVTFVDETPNVPEQVAFELRTPAYVPNGYTISSEQKLPSNHRIVYTNEDGNRIRYAQTQKESADVRIDTENTIYTEITINEYIGVTYNNKGITTILFSDTHYTYTLSGAVSLEELTKIAESIQ